MVKNKKATKNPKNKKGDKCFQYTVTVALNYQQINNYQQEIITLSLSLISMVGME